MVIRRSSSSQLGAVVVLTFTPAWRSGRAPTRRVDVNYSFLRLLERPDISIA